MEWRTKEPENQSLFQRFGRWLSLKQYQIEVTFGVYMFTPTEKFVFWSFVFLLSALGSIATILYLPQHIVFVLSRAWFYVSGGEGGGGVFDPTTASSSVVVVAAKKALISSLTETTTIAAAAAATTAEEILREL